MRIKSISMKNLGPIGQLKIEPREVDGHPVPIVLVGQNGAGKSLVLGTVLDAMTEARRGAFRKLAEVEGTDYLRLSQKTYVSTGQHFSHAKVEFSRENTTFAFDEVVSQMTWEEFQVAATELVAIPTLVQSEFPQSGFFKGIQLAEEDKRAIAALSFLYFPFFRYELPSWLSSGANIDFAKVNNFWGNAKLNPIRANIIPETTKWILNLVLDRELYERVMIDFPAAGGVVKVFGGYSGPNNTVVGLLNALLTDMMKARDPSVQSARLGVSPKRNRAVAIHVTREGEAEKVVAYDLSYLSSGEAMCLGLVAEIIRGHELVSGSPPTETSQISGIVLVDEIDLHLHIDLQKLVLPKLIRNFPNVQFVITTHSPFFLLGMAESGEVDAYNLPIGAPIDPHEFVEFQRAYDIFVDENNRFRERYAYLVEKATAQDRVLIVTEGKTDWQHMKRALQNLQEAGQFAELDIEFLEFGDEMNMNDTRLAEMCEYFASVPQQRRMIFVFDRDNPKIIPKVTGQNGIWKRWSPRVFSVSIPKPDHRANAEKVSIEFYYTDEAIRTLDPVSGRRLWFSNELAGDRNLTTNQFTYRPLPGPIEADELRKTIFDQDVTKVVDAAGSQVALSKSAFIELILDNQDLGPGIDRSAFARIFEVFGEIVAAD